MNRDDINTIVIGGLNVDFIFSGCEKILQEGELGESKTLSIMAGGKSRNIAQMISSLKEKKEVAMIGRTIKDTFGLWRIPVVSLEENNVDTSCIQYSTKKNALPGIAGIPVTTQGENQIYLAPGVNNDFSPDDIKRSESLFISVGKKKGILILSLEMPLPTIAYAIEMAKKYDIKVAIDTGGIRPSKVSEYKEIFSLGIDILKPNKHETEILTNIVVHDISSAKQAAKEFRKISGVSTVFITDGANGAYLFNEKKVLHIPSPHLTKNTAPDSTGCGDQTMATLCHYITQGESIEKSCQLAVLSGTLQFYKTGVQPLSEKEILENFS